jgi:Protein of unknown function (DUF1524)
MSLRKVGVLATVLAALAVVVGMGTPAPAAPPTPPDGATARTELAQLTVAPEGSDDGYDRDKFPHWLDQGDSCNTREVVLKRDGTDVETGTDCYPTSGSWSSPYDGATWSDPADVDIDHMVPLAEAWRSGASGWSQDMRADFANDLEHAQLWAVTDNVNQSKGDQDPAEWMPPSTDIHCLYSRAWVDVKFHWQMTIDQAEKDALTQLLSGC